MIDTSTLKKWLPLSILLVLALLIIYSLIGVLTIFLGAIIFYVLTRPVMKFLTQKWKFKNGLAALLIIVLSFVLILGPLILMSNVLYVKLNSILQNVSIHDSLLTATDKIEALFGVKIVTSQTILSLQKEVTGFLATIVSRTIDAVGSIAIMYFVLYYMLVNIGKLESALSQYLPFSKENITILNTELNKQIYSNAIGSPLLAIIQGIVASICYSIFNVQDALFWGMISGVFSMIPFVGSALIWLPISIMMLVNGDYFNGTAMLLAGVLVISTIDNLLRFVLQKKIADIHPLITLFGIISGLKLFGLAGVIFGPLLLSYFFILIKFYRNIKVN
jgi:predicted PurR-regulated permease PerM